MLAIYVQPKASKNRLVGIHDNALKVCVTAQPLEGKANSAVISFFAKLFGLPKAAISIKSGKQSRKKKLAVCDLKTSTAEQIIAANLPPP